MSKIKRFRNSEIYMDNAATSFPKPPDVLKAMHYYAEHIGASSGRGAYPRAVETGEMIKHTRELLAQFLGVRDPNRLIFTFNASDGLNSAIHGLNLQKGDHVVTSMIEHNSVLRPLNHLRKYKGIEVTKVQCSREGFINIKDIEQAITPRTKLVTILHASNVMGVLTPVEEIASLCRKKEIPFLVDAAQTIGSVPVNLEKWGADMVAFPGHKALLGPLGTGALYIRPGFDLIAFKQGGTGSISEQEVHPDFYPDKFESGSHNAIGIAGLKAGIEFLLKKGIKNVRKHELQLTEYFMKELKKISGITVYGPSEAKDRVAVVSINAEGFKPSQLAERLYKKGKIMTRFGMHCAPVAHTTIGTYPTGTVRFSFSIFNTIKQINNVIRGIRPRNRN